MDRGFESHWAYVRGNMELVVMPNKARFSWTEFLGTIFKGLEGYIYAPTLDRSTGKFQPVFVKHTQLARLERHIREESSRTDVYISPSVFREPKATKDNFVGSNVVWCEFDGNYAEPTVEPSITVLSSKEGHVHCYWLLDTPIDNAQDLEKVNRALAYSLGADKSGWDANQILRPPETFNFKRELPVVALSAPLARYNIGAFSTYEAPEKLEDESIRLKTIPDVMDVIYEFPLGTEFKDVFTANYEEGERSTAYMQVGYLAAEAGVSNEELYALLRNFDERIGKYADREDRHRRLLDIIERVRLKVPIQSQLGQARPSFEIFDIISFGNQDLTVEWLLPGILQQGGNMLLSGPPGAGKTQLALNFAYGLASGTDVLGYKPNEPTRILFISAEMGPTDLKCFTDLITPRYKEYKDLLQENLFVLPMGEPIYLNTPVEQNRLRSLVEALNIRGIIFDSLGSATNKALTDEEGTKSLLDFNDRFRNEMGVFTWFIHHNRKATENNKEPSGLADIYGSQYITARATTVLSIWPVKTNILKVRELKKRLAPQEDDWFIKRNSELNFTKLDPSEAATVITSKSPLGKAATNGNSNPFRI